MLYDIGNCAAWSNQKGEPQVTRHGLFALLLLLIAVLGPAPAAAEPLYHGRPLEYWVARLHDRSAPDRTEAAAAVASFGPAAAPYRDELLPLLQAPEQRARLMASLGPPVFPLLREWLREPARPKCYAGGRLEVALEAVARLASRALEFVPDLVLAARREERATEQAVGILLALGARARPAVRQLLRDPDPRVRLDAIFAIGQADLRDDDEWDLLLELLRDPVEEVRQEAASVLTWSAEDHFPKLIPLFRSRRWQDRQAAVGVTPGAPALAAAVPYLARALDDPVPAVRENAAYTLLDCIEEHPQAYTLLRRHDHDPDLAVRIFAAMARFRKTGETQPLLGLLVERIQQNKERSWWAFEALEEVGAPSAAVLPSLIHLLARPEDRWGMDEWLRKIGPAAVPWVLRRWPKTDASERAFIAGRLLPQWIEEDPRVADVLIEALDDLSDEFGLAVDPWGGPPRQEGSGPQAHPQRDRLVLRALHHPRPEANRFALRLVHETPLGEKDAERVLEFINADPRTAITAIRASGSMSEYAAQVLPALQRVLQQPDPADPVASPRVAAAEAIATLAEKSAEARRVLLTLGADRDPRVRRALFRFYPAAPEPELVALWKTLLDDPDTRVRGAAASRLVRWEPSLPGLAEIIIDMQTSPGSYTDPEWFAQLKPLPSAAVEKLRGLMQSVDTAVAVRAAVLYASATDDAESAIPVLLRGLTDLDEQVGVMAVGTLAGLRKSLQAHESELNPLLQSPRPLTRVFAGGLLAWTSGPSQRALTAIMSAFDSGDLEAVVMAQEMLSSLGPAAQPVLPALRRLRDGAMPSGNMWRADVYGWVPPGIEMTIQGIEEASRPQPPESGVPGGGDE